MIMCDDKRYVQKRNYCNHLGVLLWTPQVCILDVHEIHQNLKLMVAALPGSVTYKD